MTPASARSLARAARTRHIRCAWCNEPITTMHKAVRYCIGATCQQEAKAERQRLRRMALRGQVEGLASQPPNRPKR